METHQFKKSSYIFLINSYAHMRWYFGQFEKRVFCKTETETLFSINKVTKSHMTWHGTCGQRSSLRYLYVLQEIRSLL